MNFLKVYKRHSFLEGMQEKEAIVALYNHEGKATGSKKREDIDKNKDLLKVVKVVLFNENNEVFMIRPKDNLWKGKWGGSCAGLARKDEDISQTALRTIKRELGFETKLTIVGEKYYNFSGVRRILAVFVGRADENLVKPNEDDFSEWKWENLGKAQEMAQKGQCMPTFKAALEMINITI